MKTEHLKNGNEETPIVNASKDLTSNLRNPLISGWGWSNLTVIATPLTENNPQYEGCGGVIFVGESINLLGWDNVNRNAWTYFWANDTSNPGWAWYSLQLNLGDYCPNKIVGSLGVAEVQGYASWFVFDENNDVWICYCTTSWNWYKITNNKKYNTPMGIMISGANNTVCVFCLDDNDNLFAFENGNNIEAWSYEPMGAYKGSVPLSKPFGPFIPAPLPLGTTGNTNNLLQALVSLDTDGNLQCCCYY